MSINFGDKLGSKRGHTVDPANAALLRQCATWFMWGTKGCQTAASFKDKFTRIKPLFVACTRAGILATDLKRFPSVLNDVAASLAPSHFDHAIVVLDELLDAKDDLGFCLLDRDSIAKLVKRRPDHHPKQTPYIPPRIWTYQVLRLRECLEDYTKHQSQIEACFNFCLDAYARNWGSLRRAMMVKKDSRAPFREGTARAHYGRFSRTAERFGIDHLIEKWVGPFTTDKRQKQLVMFSQYLDLVSKSGLAYLNNFSLMRIDEAQNLRADCLVREHDERFGEILMLRGETTKTDLDSDARWPVSSSVPIALEPMKHISAMRMRCAKERSDIGLTPEDIDNPYLISYQYEPWSKGKHSNYRIRPAKWAYDQLIGHYPLLFDSSVLTITKDDLNIARLITPTLDIKIFREGQVWRFGWHQLRRTGAVNMLSSGLVDESSLQVILKHQCRAMTLYYGRNHCRLALNEETRTLFIKVLYEEMARNLRKLSSDQFISPLGDDRKTVIVNFISEAEANSLDRAARQGKLGVRRIRPGFCMNYLGCPYGGVEAIAHCLGGDKGKGCPELLADKQKQAHMKDYQKHIEIQLKSVPKESPRYLFLLGEKRGASNYFSLVRKS